MDRINRQINKDIGDLNNTVNKLDLTGNSRSLHSIAVEYRFSPSTHKTFSKIDYILDYKTSLNKFTRVERK